MNDKAKNRDIVAEAQQDRPFLRALKLAYKLHKAGMDVTRVRCYLSEADAAILRGDPLPSAAIPVTDILPATFNFADSIFGESFWANGQTLLENAQ